MINILFSNNPTSEELDRYLDGVNVAISRIGEIINHGIQSKDEQDALINHLWFITLALNNAIISDALEDLNLIKSTQSFSIAVIDTISNKAPSVNGFLTYLSQNN